MRDETNPDDVHGMLASQGIVTARGGKTSHAAVVARGFGIPCVAGAEAIRVGRAHGHTIEPLIGIEAQRIVDAAEGRGLAEVEADLAAEAKRRTGGRPSLLQDVMKRRRTEVDFLNGHVSAEGHKKGVPTPFNDAIVAAVHAHPVGQLTPSLKNLDPLIAMLSREQPP